MLTLTHHTRAMAAVASAVTDLGEVLCEVCSLENDDCSEIIPTATMRCVDCDQKLCERCSRPHKWMKAGAHQLVALETEVEQVQQQIFFCDKHINEEVKYYCKDCNRNICRLCKTFMKAHKSHNVVKKDEVDLRIVEEHILSVCIYVREQLEQTKQNVAEFLSKTDDIKNLVFATSDVIQRSLNDNVNYVLTKLQSVRSESVKEAESVQEAYQGELISLENFYADLQKLLKKGQLGDVQRAKLHDKAIELLDLGRAVTAVMYCPPNVTFTPADVTQVKHLVSIGNISFSTEEQPGESYMCCIHVVSAVCVVYFYFVMFSSFVIVS